MIYKLLLYTAVHHLDDILHLMESYAFPLADLAVYPGRDDSPCNIHISQFSELIPHPPISLSQRDQCSGSSIENKLLLVLNNN